VRSLTIVLRARHIFPKHSDSARLGKSLHELYMEAIEHVLAKHSGKGK